MFRVLVAEDDPSTQKLLCLLLAQNGFEPLPARDGTEALALMDNQQVDLLIVDIMMPRMDGYELTRQIRTVWEHMPILMLTAKQAPQDKRDGFLVGTDDYMTKPFDDQELILRIKALLRRAQIASERKMTIGEIVLNYDAMTVAKHSQIVTLPQKEFQLLFKLLSYPGIVFTRLQLMDEIWGMETETDDPTLYVHINRLRERFRDWPEFEIATVHGVGYKAVKNT